MLKQELTITISRETIRKAKVVAVRHGTSISGLLAQQIDLLFGDAYQLAQMQAFALLDQGFNLGGKFDAIRHEWHER